MAKRALLGATAVQPAGRALGPGGAGEGEPTRASGPGGGPQITSKTRGLIDGIREDFRAYVDDFTQLTVSRETLAPRFMKAFAAWAQETGGPFVAFCRVLEPAIPEDREGYRAHPAYQAADYLRRLTAAQTGGRERDQIPEGERPIPVYRAFAMFLATVLPAIDPNGTLWGAFVKEMHWSEDQANRIRVTATKAGAISLPARLKAQFRPSQAA